MDPDQAAAPGSPESRTGAFSLGVDSQKFNAMVPKSVVQSSVLQPSRVSGNGMASADYERVLPGMSKPLVSSNGSSTQSYQDSMFMRLQGMQES